MLTKGWTTTTQGSVCCQLTVFFCPCLKYLTWHDGYRLLADCGRVLRPANWVVDRTKNVAERSRLERVLPDFGRDAC